MSESRPLPPRIVLDTNVLLRALVNSRTASGRVLAAVDERSAVLLLSRPVLAEYRAVLTDPEIVARYPELKPERIEVVLRRLRYFSQYEHPVRERFDFPRDPRDSKLIELAIAARATHLVTSDKDLLSLATSYSDAAKRLRQRLPGLQIVGPAEFLQELRPKP